MLSSSSPNSYVSAPPFLLSSKLVFLTPAPLTPGLSVDAGEHDAVSLSTETIVGGGIASVLALAATALIVVALYGRAGLTRLLAKLLSSCLNGTLLRSGLSLRIKSLRDVFHHKRHSPHGGAEKTKGADSNDSNAEGSSRADTERTRGLLSEIFGGRSLSTTASKRDSMARPEDTSTELAPLENIVKKQVAQLETSIHASIHAYIVTTVSDLVELEMGKAKEEMRQERVDETGRGCAGSLVLSVADNVIEDLRSDLNEEEIEVETSAQSREASASEQVEGMWMQPLDTAISIVEEAMRIGADVASTSSSLVTQEPELPEEEAVLHSKQRGKQCLANPDVEAEESGQGDLKHTVLLIDDCQTSEKVYEVQKSNISEPIQLLEETTNDPSSQKPKPGEGTSAGLPASHKQDSDSEGASGASNSLALVPTTATGDINANNVAMTQTIDPKPTKVVMPIQRKLRRPRWARNEVMLKTSSKRRKKQGHIIATNNMKKMGAMIIVPTNKPPVLHQNLNKTETHHKRERKDAISKANCKRPWNVGHMSFSCKISVHRVHFFTSFMCKGTYGSTRTSLDHTSANSSNAHLLDQDVNTHHQDSTSFVSSMDVPNRPHHQLYAPLHNDYQYNLMHQLHYDPSKLIPTQCKSKREAPYLKEHTTPLLITHVETIENSSAFKENYDYGGPFDGVL